MLNAMALFGVLWLSGAMLPAHGLMVGSALDTAVEAGAQESHAPMTKRAVNDMVNRRALLPTVLWVQEHGVDEVRKFIRQAAEEHSLLHFDGNTMLLQVCPNGYRTLSGVRDFLYIYEITEDKKPVPTTVPRFDARVVGIKFLPDDEGEGKVMISFWKGMDGPVVDYVLAVEGLLRGDHPFIGEAVEAR